MLSAISFLATVFVIAGGIILVSVGIVALGHLFVQDFIDRHERRFHRDDAKRTAAGADGK
jgi:hypothetical protein